CECRCKDVCGSINCKWMVKLWRNISSFSSNFLLNVLGALVSGVIAFTFGIIGLVITGGNPWGAYIGGVIGSVIGSLVANYLTAAMAHSNTMYGLHPQAIACMNCIFNCAGNHSAPYMWALGGLISGIIGAKSDTDFPIDRWGLGSFLSDIAWGIGIPGNNLWQVTNPLSLNRAL